MSSQRLEANSEAIGGVKAKDIDVLKQMRDWRIALEATGQINGYQRKELSSLRRVIAAIEEMLRGDL